MGLLESSRRQGTGGTEEGRRSLDKLVFVVAPSVPECLQVCYFATPGNA